MFNPSSSCKQRISAEFKFAFSRILAAGQKHLCNAVSELLTPNEVKQTEALRCSTIKIDKEPTFFRTSFPVQQKALELPATGGFYSFAFYERTASQAISAFVHLAGVCPWSRLLMGLQWCERCQQHPKDRLGHSSTCQRGANLPLNQTCHSNADNSFRRVPEERAVRLCYVPHLEQTASNSTELVTQGVRRLKTLFMIELSASPWCHGTHTYPGVWKQSALRHQSSTRGKLRSTDWLPTCIVTSS